MCVCVSAGSLLLGAGDKLAPLPPPAHNWDSDRHLLRPLLVYGWRSLTLTDALKTNFERRGVTSVIGSKELVSFLTGTL